MRNEEEQDYTPPEQGIGERIRIKRAEIAGGLSVEDLSRVCKEFDPEKQGISRLALSRYEAGKFVPGARELRILCDALGISPNWLLLGKDIDRWPQSTYEMVNALDKWVRERANTGDMSDLIHGYSPDVDMVRIERINKAIEKKTRA
jgi:transcriptional regulator with XRE-family HTH domain